MAVQENTRLFGFIREVTLTPRQIEALERDGITRRWMPGLVRGRGLPDGRVRIRETFLGKRIPRILDASVEGDVI